LIGTVASVFEGSSCGITAGPASAARVPGPQRLWKRTSRRLLTVSPTNFCPTCSSCC